MCVALDSGEVDRYVSHFTEDARFRFGNSPPVYGRDEVGAAARSALDLVTAIRHSIVGVWRQGDVVIAEFSIDFTRPDGDVVTLPCASIMRFDGAQVRDYRVSMDLGPVVA